MLPYAMIHRTQNPVLPFYRIHKLKKNKNTTENHFVDLLFYVLLLPPVYKLIAYQLELWSFCRHNGMFAFRFDRK